MHKSIPHRTPRCYARRMTTYRDAGVDVAKGDSASKAAYSRASSTFASRKGMIGAPVFEEDGYAGLLDMGDYYLIQTTDGTGTKIDLACEMGVYETLGSDLLAMVADDAVCTGAEVLSVSNCIDVAKVDQDVISALLDGLAKVATAQKIVIPAGEIAEVPGAVSRAVWSATAVGVLEKHKVLRPERLAEGDVVISLREHGPRSNGYSLIRKVLQDTLGKEWHKQEWQNGTTWGQAMLSPSIVYHAAVLSLTGRFGQPATVNVKGVSHITGGGIPSKFRRILKKNGLGANLNALWAPPPALEALRLLGNVSLEEAYRTWNMGNGMFVVVAPADADASVKLLNAAGTEAKIAGIITKDPAMCITAADGSTLSFA